MPAYRTTSNLALEDLNKLKNRYKIPSASDFYKDITLASLLAPGNDENRFNVNEAVEITGYVMEVKPGGTEGCNCKATDRAYQDTHIVLIADPKITNGSKRVIVEVTPRMRFLMSKNGIDWSTTTLASELKGHWITVQGWLFYDKEHFAEAENTSPENAKDWRGTAWEVHPITHIEVVKNQ